MSENSEVQIIWESTVDQGAWRVVVEAIPNRSSRAVLKVFNGTSGELGYQEEVPVSYDAIFGPDVADLDDWANKALTWIDAQSPS